MNHVLQPFAVWSLRLSLAAAFASAVADRFGGWGLPGAANVAWGDWPHFIAYTGRLLWFLPGAWVNMFGWLATIAEAALALWLLAGIRLRVAAMASAALLLSFALTMTLALGIKAPLNYSVFTGVAAALALACLIPAPRRAVEAANTASRPRERPGNHPL